MILLRVSVAGKGEEMRLPVMEYMRFARSDRSVEFDLSRSGMPEYPVEKLGVPPESLLLPEGNDWGSPSLRSAIASSFSLPEKNVLPSHGTTFALFLVCAALLEHGDRVLVEEPAYEPLRSIPLLSGARVDRFPRTFENRYRIDRERFLRAITPETRLVILSDPHNPSGVLLSHEEREWLAETAEKNDVDILVDEVYLDFAQSEDEPVFPHALLYGERLISVSSLTKVYGLGRLRIGWIVAREELIERIAPLYDYTLGDLSGPSVALGVAALTKRAALLSKTRRLSDENRRVFNSWMKDRPELECVPPDTGIVAFPRLRVGPLSSRFADHARDTQSVLVVPGDYFEDPHAMRIGFGIETDRLRMALDRLTDALGRFE